MLGPLRAVRDAVPPIAHCVLDVLPRGRAAVLVAVPSTAHVAFGLGPLLAVVQPCALEAVTISGTIELEAAICDDVGARRPVVAPIRLFRLPVSELLLRGLEALRRVCIWLRHDDRPFVGDAVRVRRSHASRALRAESLPQILPEPGDRRRPCLARRVGVRLHDRPCLLYTSDAAD